MTQKQPDFREPIEDVAEVARALGVAADAIGPGDLAPRVVDTGIPWFVIPIVDLRTLSSLAPDPRLCLAIADQIGTDLFYAFTQDTDDPDCTARSRHVWFGTVTPGEDPATGSACGCLGAYLVKEGVMLASNKVKASIEQGVEIGRRSKAQVWVDAKSPDQIERVQVGGRAVHVGRGEIWLPAEISAERT